MTDKKKRFNKITVFGAFIQAIITVGLFNWYLVWTLTGFELFMMTLTYMGVTGVWELVGIFRLRSMPKPPKEPKPPEKVKPSIMMN